MIFPLKIVYLPTWSKNSTFYFLSAEKAFGEKKKKTCSKIVDFIQMGEVKERMPPVSQVSVTGTYVKAFG